MNLESRSSYIYCRATINVWDGLPECSDEMVLAHLDAELTSPVTMDISMILNSSEINQRYQPVSELMYVVLSQISDVDDNLLLIVMTTFRNFMRFICFVESESIGFLLVQGKADTTFFYTRLKEEFILDTLGDVVEKLVDNHLVRTFQYYLPGTIFKSLRAGKEADIEYIVEGVLLFLLLHRVLI